MNEGSAAKLLGVAAISAATSSLITYAIFRRQRTERKLLDETFDVSTPTRNGEMPSLDNFIPSSGPLVEVRPVPRDPFDPRPRTG